MALRDFSQLLRVLPEAAFLADADGSLLAINEALVEMSGLTADRMLGQALTALVADPGDKVQDYLRLCARSRQPLPGALRWRKADGRLIEVRCDGALLAPRSETTSAVLFMQCRPKAEAVDRFTLLNRKIEALTREIFERKRAEQQRDELLRREHQGRLEAERLNRMKDEFLATLSHELRTPIHAILGWTQALRQPGLPVAKRDAALRTIERNARAQARIIDDLLDMSSIISGKVRIQAQPVALAPVIEAAIESIRPTAQAKSLRLETQVDTAECWVQGDSHRLQQVVWNLLSNAVKFTPRDGTVRVQLEVGASEARILVSDSGEGIRSDFLPYVFDRFRQADASTTRRHGGLGLGLSIVKQIVELHGGRVQVESAGTGQGASFSIDLPCSARKAAKAEAASAVVLPAARSTQLPSLQGLHVLVVDDDPDGREVIQVLLESRGCAVSTAASASQALKLLQERRPDLLLCDIGMPDIDGCELLVMLREWQADQGGATPAIALTAFAGPEDRVRALNAGFDAHLVKPVEIGELFAMLARLAPAWRAPP